MLYFHDLCEFLVIQAVDFPCSVQSVVVWEQVLQSSLEGDILRLYQFPHLLHRLDIGLRHLPFWLSACRRDFAQASDLDDGIDRGVVTYQGCMASVALAYVHAEPFEADPRVLDHRPQ